MVLVVGGVRVRLCWGSFSSDLWGWVGAIRCQLATTKWLQETGGWTGHFWTLFLLGVTDCIILILNQLIMWMCAIYVTRWGLRNRNSLYLPRLCYLWHLYQFLLLNRIPPGWSSVKSLHKETPYFCHWFAVKSILVPCQTYCYCTPWWGRGRWRVRVGWPSSTHVMFVQSCCCCCCCLGQKQNLLGLWQTLFLYKGSWQLRHPTTFRCGHCNLIQRISNTTIMICHGCSFFPSVASLSWLQ